MSTSTPSPQPAQVRSREENTSQEKAAKAPKKKADKPADAPRGPREGVMSALRRQWWLPVALCPLGAALGVGAAIATPTTYTAETRVAIGKGSIGAQAIPGFALAIQQLADTYARWVNNTTIDGVEIVSSNIPESGLVRIEAKANSQAKALEQARKTAEDLVKQVNTPKAGNDPAQVLKEYQAASAKASALETQVAAANQRYQNLVGNGATAARQNAGAEELNKVKEQASVAQVQAQALNDKYRRIQGEQTDAVDLVIVREAAISKNDQAAKMQRYGFAGFLLGGLASLGLAARSRKPLNTIAPRVEGGQPA